MNSVISKILWVALIFSLLWLQLGEPLQNEYVEVNPAKLDGGAAIDDGHNIDKLLIARAVNNVSNIPSGFRVTHPKYFADFTQKGLEFRPVSHAPEFSWSFAGEDQVQPEFIGDKIIYHREYFTEEYILKSQTIEQQFIINEPLPEGESLTITGLIRSSGIFTKENNGWAWKNDLGQVTFSNVYVFDALDRSIPARMSVDASSTEIKVEAEDLEDAVFPVTIDPEIGTNDFRISTFGSDGDLTDLAFDPAISYSSTKNKYLVVWEGNSSSEHEIYGQLLNGNTGAPEGSTITISESPSGAVSRDSTDPDIACSGDKFFVVWRSDDTYSFLTVEPLDDEFEIFGRIVDAENGTPEGNLIRISDMGADGDATYSAFSPAIVYNSTGNAGNPEYLVAWYGDDDTGSLIDEEFEIYVQRLNTSGVEIGLNDIRISDLGPDGFSELQGFSPDIAWNSTNNKYLVVWHGDDIIVPLADDEKEIFIQRLTSTAVEEGLNDFRLSFMGPNGNTAYGAFNPSVAYNSVDNNYLIAWYGDDDSGSLVDNENEVYSVIVSNAGVPGTITRTSDMGPDGNANYDAINPAVAHDPYLNQFLVIWYGDDDSGSLIDNENEIFYQLFTGAGAESGSDTRVSDVGGTGNSTYNAFRPSLVYNDAMREFIISWDADDNIGSLVDNEFEIWGQRFAELDTKPTSPATSILASSITQSSFTVSFSAAAGTPDGYIALRKTGSSPTDVPLDHTVYSIGDPIGTSTVAYVGSSLTFDESSLLANTTYYYDIFSYNGVNSSTNYLTSASLEGSVNTLFAEPTTQTTAILFSNLLPDSITIDFTDGNGSSRLLVGREGLSVNDFPQDGNDYTPNNEFGSGPDLGSSTFVVGEGSGPFTIFGLSSATEYHFQVFEFNGTGILTKYKESSTTNNPSSIFTLSPEPSNQPAGLSFSTIEDSSMTVSFTAATGNPDGYIVVRKEGSSPIGKPIDGKIYAVNDTVGIGGDGTVVYHGSNVSFTSSGLIPETDYHYAIFSFNGSGTNVNFLNASPLEGNAATLAIEPAAQPTVLTFNSITSTSMNGAFTTATGNPDGYIVVRKESASPTGNPIDGKTYAAGDTVGTGGDGTVVYSGSSVAFTSSELTSGTLYYYAIFSFEGSGVSVNYITTSPLVGSQTTYAPEPVNQPADLVFSDITTNSLTGSFTVAADNPTGYLVLRKEGSAGAELPANGLSYSVNEVIGASTVIYVGSEITFPSTGQNAGTVYHFAVYSSNGLGLTLNYLEANPLASSVITISPSPEVLDPTQIALTNFTAAWNASLGAVKYELDVSADNFATFVPGYEAREVTSGLEEAVTELTPNTAYKYRVRAVNTSGTSAKSLDKSVTTLEEVIPNPLQISIPTILSNANGYTVSVTLLGGSGARDVKFYSRGITAQNFIESILTSSTGTYEAPVPDSELDELGLEFYFAATDDLSTAPLTSAGFIYREIVVEETSLQGLASGGLKENYRIISIPYDLEDNLVQSIFGTLGEYDNSKWRLIRYQNGKNVDFPAFNRIVNGHSYWFNSVDPVEIKLGTGTVPKYNQQNSFNLALAKGWNQIGDPFPFDINWSDVQDANPGAIMSSLKVYQSSTLSFLETDNLKVWSGGFVFADNSVQISFPVTLKTSTGSRKSGKVANEIESGQLDNNEWFVPLRLTHGKGLNTMIGFGMHPDAAESKDRYDDITLPRFFNYLEMKTEHDEFFAPFFTKDVVRAATQYRWKFVVQSNFVGETASLEWDPSRFGENNSMLLLYDVSKQRFINMKSNSNYEFDLNNSKQFEFIYSMEEDSWQSDFTLLGLPYPNPVREIVNIPLIVKDQQVVAVEILDLMGRGVKSLYKGTPSGGTHTITWDRTNETNERVSPGVYLINLVSGRNRQVKKIIVK